MHKIKIFIAGVLLVFGNLACAGGDLLSCANAELRQAIVLKAQAEIGYKENIAANDGLRLRVYRTVTGLANYPVPWCAIFVKFIYTSVNVTTPGNAWVPSWSARPQFVIYKRGAKDNQYPCAGDAVTFYYPHMGREAHIALVKRWPVDGDYFYTIEGNTNNNGSREGDGVYEKRRRKSDAYKIMRFV